MPSVLNETLLVFSIDPHMCIRQTRGREERRDKKVSKRDVWLRAPQSIAHFI